MATLKVIEAAIKLIDSKKESLKKAYEELQSHSSLLSPSISLSWSDIDAHFTSSQELIMKRFKDLESIDSKTPAEEELLLSDSHRVDAVPAPSRLVSSSEDSPVALCSRNGEVDAVARLELVSTVVARSELRELCEKMDGQGLRNYISEKSEEGEAIRSELVDALRCAPDPGALVLDAVYGFYNTETDNNVPDMFVFRRSCVTLMEQLKELNPSFSADVTERAKKFAFEWKMKASLDVNKALTALGFLHLLATYRLASEIDSDELMNYVVAVSKFRQIAALCRAIGLGEDVIIGLIQKLLDSDKYLCAIKFVFEFQMTDKFPPVPILEAYLQETKNSSNKICQLDNNSIRTLNEATAKQVSALKAVIKVIEEHNLDDVYPRKNLEKRIEELDKEKAERKHPTPVVPSKTQQQQPPKNDQNKRPQQQKQWQGKNKRPWAGQAGGSATGISTRPHYLQHMPTGSLPDLSIVYPSTQPRQFGLVDSGAPYVGPIAGVYGVSQAHAGQSGNGNPSHQISNYGAYLPPPHHPAYYPQ